MEPQQEKPRAGLYLILHALAWAGVMLGSSYVFKDYAWSEDLFLWLVAGFVLSNGLLLGAVGRRRPRC